MSRMSSILMFTYKKNINYDYNDYGIYDYGNGMCEIIKIKKYCQAEAWVSNILIKLKK